MSLQFRRATVADLHAIVALLRSHSLPTDGVGDLVRAHADHIIVAELQGAIVGTAALDVTGAHALLRSVAVARDLATLGVGTTLVTDAIALARTLKLESIVLLTTTAQEWFPRFGFVVADRASAPQEFATHVEFTSACPASAVYMSYTL
jgi:amino-acid N-acetyltransferase